MTQHVERVILALLRNHGYGPDQTRIVDGKVEAHAAYSKREADGSIVSWYQWEPVGTSLRAVREWLGY